MLGEQIIDIIQEWVQAQGYLTAAFIDRGDPAADDFTQAVLTTDGFYNSLDLSGIIPANAKAVLLTLIVKDNLIGQVIKLRKKGNVNDKNFSIIYTLIANTRNTGDFTVALDNNRTIQYLASAVVWDEIIIKIRGWWL